MDTFPAGAPGWLERKVLEPDCTIGTHTALRQVAKWLVFYMPPAKNPGLAAKWLKESAARCDRVPDDSELKRLLSWALGIQGQSDEEDYQQRDPVKIDQDFIFDLVIQGPRRSEYRELSPINLYDTADRQTEDVLDAWAHYAGIADPWVCYGADDAFETKRFSDMRERASIFAQVVPSPMKEQWGRTQDDGHLSKHTLDATAPRLFLVTEFDFSPSDQAKEAE